MKNIFEEISVALASGLAIEASVHKPGTTSPIRSTKGIYHHGFIISSMLLSHAIKDLLIKIDLSKNECIDISYVIKELYIRGEKIHRMGNLHLGFVFLIAPLIAIIPRYIKENLQNRSCVDNKIFGKYEELLEKASENLVVCGRRSRLVYLWDILRKIYGQKIYLHEGPTPDLYKKEDSDKSLWDLVYYGRNTDIILRELYSGYEITRRYSKRIITSEDSELYRNVLNIFIDIASEYIDTHIARTKNIVTAIIFKSNMNLCKEVNKFSIKIREECINYFDNFYRDHGINPGSIADLVAFMISIRNLVMLEVHVIDNT